MAFVRAHLPQESSESVGRPGKRWLSNSSIKQMQTSSVKLPENSPGSVTDWGLGWCLMDGGRNPIVGHDGATFGQCCLVNMLPEQGLIFSVQTNCTQGSVLKTVFNDVMATLANIRFTPAEPSESLLNPDSVVGTYDSFDAIITVSLNGSELIAIRKDKVLGLPDETWNLKSIDENAMAVYSKNGERIDNIVFLDRNAKGQAGYLYASFCVYRRVSI